MKNIPYKSEIEKLISPNQWDFGNSILYKLCEENFEHKEHDKVVAKIWLIGKSYSAAIERRKNKTKEEDNNTFYREKVAPTFINSIIDSKLKLISKESFISESNFVEILEVHKYLMDEIKKITSLDKRSLCSKYLHFHIPRLFFIYDSYAVRGLRNYSISIPSKYTHIISSARIDTEYAKFFIKSYLFRDHLQEKYNLQINTRDLDKILIPS